MGRNVFLPVKETEPCMFLVEGRCQIYSVRPTTCNLYPFMSGDIQGEGKWKGIVVPQQCKSAVKTFRLIASTRAMGGEELQKKGEAFARRLAKYGERIWGS